MKRRLLTVALVLALCFTLFGCGSTATKPEAPDGAAEGSVIKIGVVLPFSGASEYVGNAQFKGYEYALKDFEEHYSDQLNGATIELVTGDSTGVADTGVTELERLINDEGVCAVIGTYNSGVAAAMAPVAIKYGVPFMVTNAVADTILSQDSKYVYRTNMGDMDAAPSYRDFVEYLNKTKNAGIENVAIIYEASDYGQGAFDNLKNNVFGQLGINIVMEESFTANSGDLSTVINKLKASGADATCVVMGENDALLFTRQMQEYKVSMPIIAYGGGFIADNYIEQAGSAAEQIFASASYIYDPSAMTEDALAIADDFVNTTEYTQMNEAFANGWLGMYSLLEAIAREGGAADSEAIADALDGTDLTTGDRALLFHPTILAIQYSDDEVRYNQNTFAGMQFGQILDGSYKLVFPAGEGVTDLKWPEK